MTKSDSKQALIPSDDDEQWEKVLRGEVEFDPNNPTHVEARDLRQYLLNNEIQKALETVPPERELNFISEEEAKVKYQYASDEIHRRAGKYQNHWSKYGPVTLFGIMTGLMAFFAGHYFSDSGSVALSTSNNRVDTVTFGNEYKVHNAGEPGRIPNLLPIPSGAFTMGCSQGWDDAAGGCKDNEYPAHLVSIQAFEMAQHEVTVGQFRHFVEDSNYKTIAETKGCVVKDEESPAPRWVMDRSANWRSPGFEQDDSHAVVCIARPDAFAYIDWLNKQTKKQYRLPTESEWEYAARAGSATAYSWGSQADHNRANFKGKNGLDTWEYTSPAGTFPGNNFSLQDMSGNAWEWVSDCWHDNYVSAPNDGSSWNTNCHGNDFITRRGGAWDAPPLSIRSSYRNHAGENDRSQSYGFRVAGDIEDETSTLKKP